MITFEDVCWMLYGKSPEEVREIIKGEYKIEIKNIAPMQADLTPKKD